MSDGKAKQIADSTDLLRVAKQVPVWPDRIPATEVALRHFRAPNPI